MDRLQCKMEIPGEEWSNLKVPSVGGMDIFWNYTIIDVFSILLTASVRTCQLSRIKESYELYCDFILGFSHFFSKFQFSLIHSLVSGASLHVFHH